ncbi:MAG: recombinase family protein [Magnetococcales bacterium]|nr:recombinase family protein [Magnetococcales bacterium]
MNIGYARSSILESQADFDAHIERLEKAGCDKVFSEQTSSVGLREQLELAIHRSGKGDVFTVATLASLARSTSHLVKLTTKFLERGVRLVVLEPGLDSGTPNGRLMIATLEAVAKFENDLLLERQREGIARAKDEGKYLGRKPTAKAKTKEILDLRDKGFGVTDIVNKLNISRASYYRILKAQTDIYG